MIYCDLDKFKLCNDTYGQTAGDVVLKEFARILSDACGYNGKAVRYGGDEFLLILKDTDKEKIKNIIDYIYKNIMNSEGFSEEISKQLGEHIYIEESNRVSTSIGVAGIEGRITAEIISELISRADKALYYVKEHGKGKSSFFEDIVSTK